MKKIAAVVLAVGVLLGTAGCGSPDPTTGETGGATLTEQAIQLKDGRIVSCVVRSSGYAGGLSCDWANAK